MSVDPPFAQWLQAAADFVVRSDATIIGRWGATAVTSERVTGIATLADAQVEADRELAFFARGPFAVETHVVTGTDWEPSLGLVVSLRIDQLGYDAGLDVLVIGVETDHGTGLTTLTVVRSLRGSS